MAKLLVQRSRARKLLLPIRAAGPFRRPQKQSVDASHSTQAGVSLCGLLTSELTSPTVISSAS